MTVDTPQKIRPVLTLCKSYISKTKSYFDAKKDNKSKFALNRLRTSSVNIPS